MVWQLGNSSSAVSPPGGGDAGGPRRAAWRNASSVAADLYVWHPARCRTAAVTWAKFAQCLGARRLAMVGDSTLRNVFYEMITFAQGRSDQSWASNFDYTQQLSDGVGGLQDVRYFETYGYDGPIYPARFATWLLTDRSIDR
jgi:hypothetical protein